MKLIPFLAPKVFNPWLVHTYYCCIIQKSWDVGSATNRWMDKEVWHIHTAELYSAVEKRKWWHLQENRWTGHDYTKQNKADTERWILPSFSQRQVPDLYTCMVQTWKQPILKWSGEIDNRMYTTWKKKGSNACVGGPVGSHRRPGQEARRRATGAKQVWKCCGWTHYFECSEKQD